MNLVSPFSKKLNLLKLLSLGKSPILCRFYVIAFTAGHVIGLIPAYATFKGRVIGGATQERHRRPPSIHRFIVKETQHIQDKLRSKAIH